MQLLKEQIIQNSSILADNKIDTSAFLNQKVDCELLLSCAKEFAKRFSDVEINKILTVESSGIAVAFPVAQIMHVPLIVAKKKNNINANAHVYSTKIISYTHFREFDVTVAKKFLTPEDKVLIIDDILSNGSSLKGLLGIMEMSPAQLVGIGVVLEKTFQRGSKIVKDAGHRLESLLKIKSIDYENHKIEFL